jgi:hypothetical protein
LADSYFRLAQRGSGFVFASRSISLSAAECSSPRILRLFGPSAFECTKEAVAVHEAGHIVIYFLLGFRVKVAQIAVAPSGGWIGYTATHEREYEGRQPQRQP